MTMRFEKSELVLVFVSVFVINLVVQDRRSTHVTSAICIITYILHFPSV
jgi:Ca2+/H+ antiporter